MTWKKMFNKLLFFIAKEHLCTVLKQLLKSNENVVARK
jgi:hypothetical protein